MMRIVCEILDDIKARGMDAALAYTEKFDHLTLTPDEVWWHPLQSDSLAIPDDQRHAIDTAARQIRRYHEAMKPQAPPVLHNGPLVTTSRWVPLTRVGLYVPNGGFPLISSVMMTAIPAQVAGVSEIVVAIPPRGDVKNNPLWRYVLQLLQIDTVLLLGGAQAIGVLGYGVPGFSPVDLIAGPGNAYVAEAKQELFRRKVVGIDGVAGPSEVLVLADGSAN
ncbi:MAG: histidinol dehydrogenase, partial [Sulfobacillus thermotolerans]|nr:histidinol dehydrogenase [Sulfobacillus thermotolerans]